MKDLLAYLDDKKISVKGFSDNTVEIDGKVFELVLPTDGKLIDSNFHLITDKSNADYFVFKLAGKWYYSPCSSVKVRLNPLSYLGVSDFVMRQTESFLGVHGGFEILNGSGQYIDWAKKAKFLGVKYLGICEKNTLAGIMHFQNACKSKGIIPIIGETVTVKKNNPEFNYDIKCYVKDEQGWENLLLINKELNVINHKFIYENRFLELLTGLVVVLDPKSLPLEKAFPYDVTYDYYYQLDTAAFLDQDIDKNYLLNLRKFVKSKFKPIPIVDAYYLEPEHYDIKQILNKISCVYDLKSENQYFKDNDQYLEELSCLVKDDGRFVEIFDILFKNESILVSHCSKFEIKTGQRHLPKYKMLPEESAIYKDNEDMFWSLISDGLNRVNPDRDIDIYIERVKTEVEVIEFGNVMDYFLTLYDICRWCKNNDIIVGIGRGSAGGSLVSMLLGIIHLDPLDFDLLFERFLNKGRVEKTLPDIDTDIEALRRNDVKHYMEQRFGEDQVISVGTYTALQLKASIKDLARVYNIDFDDVNYITGKIEDDMDKFEDLIELACDKPVVKEFINSYPEMINYIPLIIGQPKAKSVHACAMIIYPEEKDMFRWAPVCKQGDLYVSEWEGAEMEQVGFLKEDILGVKQLDKIRNFNHLIKASGKEEIDIYKIPYDDEEVLRYFRNGFNGDVFHFGSRGLTKYCKQLQPENINDLVAGISLYRPGAIENNFHNEYVLRKNGDKPVEFFKGSDEILKYTYGVFVYQEQIMKLCQVLGGLSLVEADDVRKAMVKKKYEELTKYKERFLEYYPKTFGVDDKYADHVWDQIDKASTYLFNKSHAAAYAITGYISQWFKVHYPIEYWTTAFEFMSQEDVKQNKIPQYISEIHKTGSINISSVDINVSSTSMTTSGNTIYWAISSIKDIGEIAANQILQEREKNGKYFSLEEFISRHNFIGSKVNKTTFENLIFAGAFDNIESIDTSVKRKGLIEKFREIKKVKVEQDKDLFTLAGDLVYEDWWWNLMQKRLAGVAFFDYEEMCDKYLHDFEFLDSSEFQEDSVNPDIYYAVGGYVTDFSISETSKKGTYCRFTLESNYNYLKVTVFPDQYKKLVASGIDFASSVNNLMIVSGKIRDDDFHKENTMKVWDDSEVVILKPL